MTSNNTKKYICPICNYNIIQVLFQVKGWEHFDRANIYEVCRCAHCQITFTYPILPPEKLAVFYTQGMYKATRNRFYSVVEHVQTMFQWVRLRKIARVCARGKLLDIGCGKGRFLMYAAAHGWEVCGVEPSETSRNIARAKLGNRVVSSLDELDPHEQFDVITLWHVLEHVPTPTPMLQQIRSYLKPNGTLLVAVPNFDSLQARLGKELWSHLDIPRHCLHYTPNTLTTILSSSEYTVTYIDYFSIEFNPIGALQTILNILRCEPMLIYNIFKRNFTYSRTRKTTFFYSLLAAIIGIPILILPAVIFAYFESAIGRGGTMLIYATKALPER